MARETAAQRDARFATERDARLSREVAEYPQRLMYVLERATQSPNWFTLTVRDAKFWLVNDRETWELPLVYTAQAWADLESVTWDVDRREAALAEEQRLREVKAEALRKVNELLTPEERKSLSL